MNSKQIKIEQYKRLKTILYYMHFYKGKYHTYTIKDHYELKIHQLINYNSCQLLDKVELLQKTKAINFTDIFNEDNLLHNLANDIIKTLKLFDNNKIEYTLTKFDNGKIGYTTAIR